MRKIHFLTMASIFLFSTASYAEISGTVIDAETGQPIEGAVVLVEWTKRVGFPGLQHTESAKVVEAVTDKDGKFTIDDSDTSSAKPPHVTVYKKGYVAWNNERIFPTNEKRTDFKWENEYIYRLEKFKRPYSYIDHVSFIRSSIHSETASEKKDMFKKAFEWEVNETLQEMEKKKGDQ